MKLLKVGRSASCNIVLPSENVSSLHAEILILDNGEIYIKDKNSTNGTKVGNKKISPNVEVPIRRGDYVVLGDMELPWNRVPQAENLSNYKTVLNIGTDFKNDIVIEGQYCSHFHASFRISKNGRKAFIRDQGSLNGVKVNGVKIRPNSDVEIKKNDVVVCGDTDISEELKPHIPNPYWWVKKAAIACCGIAALVAVIILLLPNPVPPNPVPDPTPMPTPQIPSLTEIRTGVVYVDACYHYVVKFENSPIHDDIWDGILEFSHPSSLKYYSATAFFIDRVGRMATNRHVAVPWEYADESEKKDIQTDLETLMAKIPNYCININQLISLKEEGGVIAQIAQIILLQANKNGNTMIDESGTILRDGITPIIRGLKKCDYTISGKLDDITVGYSGRNYTHTDEFDRCYVLEESQTKDQDIAILQMNNKKTPSDVQFVFEVNNFRTETLEPLKDKLYTVGFPRGIAWALDQSTHSMEPVIRETKCSKIPGKYDFEFQGESQGGASGSPIFDEQGRLVGVLWGRWAAGTTFGKACQAKWLKQLYKKAIGEIE